jgi:farnesyl-diphosphate farnesyltransferase
MAHASIARYEATAMTRALSATDLGLLLEQTSRTFALAIPLLPPSLARSVGAAYLLFRIADTLEDASRWDRDRRLGALDAFASWLDGGPASFVDEVRRDPPVDDRACVDLVLRAEEVLATVEGEAVILEHVKRTAEGMRAFVARQDEGGALTLATEDDLAAYCYVVAGIVGEMLTELFIAEDAAVARVATKLRENAKAFGEGLQLVNVLKDAPSDEREGRSYLPRSVPRARIMERARRDLVAAEEYVEALRSANEGIVAFCDLPRRLAEATLDALERGAAKLDRDEVMRIVRDVTG